MFSIKMGYILFWRPHCKLSNFGGVFMEPRQPEKKRKEIVWNTWRHLMYRSGDLGENFIEWCLNLVPEPVASSLLLFELLPQNARKYGFQILHQSIYLVFRYVTHVLYLFFPYKPLVYTSYFENRRLHLFQINIYSAPEILLPFSFFKG